MKICWSEWRGCVYWQWGGRRNLNECLLVWRWTINMSPNWSNDDCAVWRIIFAPPPPSFSSGASVRRVTSFGGSAAAPMLSGNYVEWRWLLLRTARHNRHQLNEEEGAMVRKKQLVCAVALFLLALPMQNMASVPGRSRRVNAVSPITLSGSQVSLAQENRPATLIYPPSLASVFRCHHFRRLLLSPYAGAATSFIHLICINSRTPLS